MLDLFAGTGALGLEALSRGAADGDLRRERRAPALALLRAQPRRLAGRGRGAGDRARRDAARAATRARRSTSSSSTRPMAAASASGRWRRRCAGGWLAPGALVVWEEGVADRPAARVDPARRAPLWERDDLHPPLPALALSEARRLLGRGLRLSRLPPRPGGDRRGRRGRAATCSPSCRPAAASRCCFQLPALTRPGVTLVISPLIALMRDQVRGAARRGRRRRGADLAEHRRGDRGDLRARSTRAACKLLYMAPERLAPPGTRRRCCAGSASRCSPSTRRIASASGATTSAPTTCGSASCAAALGGVQTVALTATADAETRAEIVARLFGGARARDLPARLRPAEPQPRLPRQGQPAPAAHRLRRARGAGRSGIVYCAQPRQDRDAGAGARARPGHPALAYHAGLEPDERRARRDAVPARGRADRLRDDRLRHGRGQARHPLRRARRPAEVDRGLLPGDRPRRARRRAGRHADALRARRHPAAAHPDRRGPGARWSARRPTTSG